MKNPTPYAVALRAKIDLSPAQAATLKAMAGEPLTKTELSAFRKLTGQILPFGGKPKAGGYAETWIRAGRRSGKSTRIAACFVVSACLGDLSTLGLAPGERARALVIGPTLGLTRQCLDAVEGLLALLGIPHVRKELEIELPGRSAFVQAVVADNLGARSATAICCVVDEAALLPFEEEAHGRDVEVIASVRPTLATTNGKLLVISSPWARSGAHFDTVEANLGKLGGRVLALDGPTWVWNQNLTEEKTRELEPDPARWAREYAARAGDDESAFVSALDVKCCVDKGIDERPQVTGASYACAIDAAFRNDSFAVTVGHKEIEYIPNAPPRERVVVDLIRVFSPSAGQRLDFDEVTRHAAQIAKRFRVRTIVRDSYSGDALDSRFRALGLKSEEVSMHASAQQIRFELLSQLIRTHDFRLVDHPKAIKELSELRIRKHQQGRIEVSAPNKRGKHDDVADALALLVEKCTSLPASTPGVDFEMHVTRGEDGVTFHRQWFTRRYNAHTGLMHKFPALPPWGSPAFVEVAEELRAAGSYTPETKAWFDSQKEDDASAPRSLNQKVEN